MVAAADTDDSVRHGQYVVILHTAYERQLVCVFCSRGMEGFMPRGVCPPLLGMRLGDEPSTVPGGLA